MTAGTPREEAKAIEGALPATIMASIQSTEADFIANNLLTANFAKPDLRYSGKMPIE